MKDNTKNTKKVFENQSTKSTIDDFGNLDLTKFKDNNKDKNKENVLIPLSKQSRNGNSDDDKNKASTHEERVYKFRMQRLQYIKKDIGTTKNQIEKARHHVRKDLMPIIDRIATQKFEFVRILDEAYEKQFFTFKQKEHIRKLIEERSHQLLQQYRFEPARKMYKKYVKHNRNLDTDIFNSASDVAKEFAEAVNDLLFDWRKDREKNKDKKRFDINEDDQSNEQNEGFRIDDLDKGNKKRVVFHSDKKDRPFDTAQALRVLYTRLAKDLHPDLERDEKRKVEKNDVMRRLTEAYKNQDLYELLQIQFEYNADNSENYTDALPEEQLKVINETLLSQIKKLQEEYKEMTVFGEDAILYRQFCAPNDPKGTLTSVKVNRHKEELVFELLSLKDEMQIVLNKEKFEKYLKEL